MVSIHATQKKRKYQVTNHMYNFNYCKWPCKGVPWVNCHAFDSMLEIMDIIWLWMVQRAETGDVYIVDNEIKC